VRRRDFVVEMSSRSLDYSPDFRIPRQVFAGQLPLDEFGIFGEEKDASLQPHFV